MAQAGTSERLVGACSSIPSGASLVVAVSGGCDSIGLLYLLLPIALSRGWRLTVAHLDHGIRGVESRRDAEFVRTLSKRWSLPVVVVRAKVPLLARRRRQSVERTAREVRYDFLARVARRVGAEAILTAHTADDQAETVVMNVCRGSGIAGLAGIPRETSWRGVRVVRPLLDVSRRDIEAALRRDCVPWRDDASNANLRYTRNRVRHVVLPVLERNLNPSVRKALCRLADICRAESAARSPEDAAALRTLGNRDGSLSVPRLLALARGDRRRVLRQWLAGRRRPDATLESVSRVEALLDNAKGGTAEAVLAGGLAVRREYDRLRIAGVRTAHPFRRRVARKGVTLVHPPGLRVRVSPARGAVKMRSTVPGELPSVCTLDARRVGRRALWVRSWRPGDRMRPYGMDGTRKVQDILTDAKVPRDRRSGVPLLECGGEVVWIPGYRIAGDWAVPSDDAPSVRVTIAAARVRARSDGCS
jgi:tRNA(Ile)-lysidine synthase